MTKKNPSRLHIMSTNSSHMWDAPNKANSKKCKRTMQNVKWFAFILFAHLGLNLSLKKKCLRVFKRGFILLHAIQTISHQFSNFWSGFYDLF